MLISLAFASVKREHPMGTISLHIPIHPQPMLFGWGMSMIILAFCAFLVCFDAIAQTVVITNSPRQFSVVSPKSWTQQPTTTGNSRVRFFSPPGTPPAECAVIVQEYPSLRNQPQAYYDAIMVEPQNPNELAAQLSTRYNNVNIMSTGSAAISGYPAQLANAQFSVGTPRGELWGRGIFVTTATIPGLVWSISCGGLGPSPIEAQKAYLYWQSEIVIFHTNLKIQ